MSRVKTFPNPYIEDDTYISVEHDWSNLMEKIETILENYNKYSSISENFRREFKKSYTVENVCLHWYEIFKNLNNVKGVI